MIPLDLASLDTVAACDAGAEIELRHPTTDEPLDIFISVLGRDSQVFKDYTRQSINARLRKEAMNRKRGRDPEVTTVEAAEEDSTAALVACSIGWRTGDVKTLLFRGQELPFNSTNALLVYNALPWIKRQVDEGIGDLANFLKA